MTLGIDTVVLVSWLMTGSPRHSDARHLIEVEARERGGSLAFIPQVVHEFLHVVTDPKRFERPLSMSEALHEIWGVRDSKEVVRILPSPEVWPRPRTLELLADRRLG